MSAAKQEQLCLTAGRAAPAGAARRSCVEIELDGMTLRTEEGEEIATLTAVGWVNPEGIRTIRVEIPIRAPVAIIGQCERAAHQRAEDEAWLIAGLEVLRAVAGRLETFTVDDVWAAIELPARDPRAQMSALMRAGEREMLIARTAKTRPSARIRRPVRIWRSLICA